MKLEFRPTIGERLYYIADVEEDAPLLELRFCNDLAKNLTGDEKREIAEKTLIFAMRQATELRVADTTEIQK
jgi:hypothetical protein